MTTPPETTPPETAHSRASGRDAAAKPATRAEPAPTPELSRRRRMGILAICCMSLLVVGLDTTIVNVALPSIGNDFHTSLSGLQWTVDAYTLVLASLLMLSGSTADRLGRRRTFQVGLLTFGLGSLLCSLSSGLGMLVAFRALQAIGGSMLNPVAMSIITNTFTDRRERAQAIGVWGGVVGISMGLGPVVGGLLVTSVGWRSIFWINVPIVVVAAVLAALYVPESKAPRPRRVDPAAQVLLIVLLASLTYGIIEGPRRGWGSPVIVGAFAVALASVVAFMLVEQRREEPLLDLRFFASIPFSGATITAVAAFGGLGGFLFMNTLYLQQVRGLSALHAGIDTLPMAAMTVVGSPLSGAVVGRRGARIPMVVAGAGIALSALMLTRITATTPIWWLILSYFVFGLGFGTVNAPITNAAVSGMPMAQAGVAAGVASTSRQVGQAFGVAVLGALATSGMHGTSYHGFAAATHAGWWVMVACGVVIVFLGFATTSARAHASAQKVAESFEGF